MARYNIPDKKHSSGPKKMCSFRLPISLEKELEEVADKKGWNKTDLLITVLDQYIEWEKKRHKKSGG